MKTTKITDPGAVLDMYDAEAESYSKLMDSKMEHPLYADTLGRLKTRVAISPMQHLAIVPDDQVIGHY
jgi:hypothetical protein